jgi:hypothetical protein
MKRSPGFEVCFFQMGHLVPLQRGDLLSGRGNKTLLRAFLVGLYNLIPVDP